MRVIRLAMLGGLVLWCAGHYAPLVADQQPSAPAAGLVSSHVTVKVPQGDAQLEVNREASVGFGDSRELDTRPAARGSAQSLTITATWQPNSYTWMTRTKTVSYRGGDPITVDLTIDDPADRVRVIYVPTPQAVAEAMVKLAGITKNDIVYEPGCGDARITIAAIQSGARRGICVDIDPERAAESAANVATAGFKNVIDVRLGDALDVKDLSDVSVVMLYMGDHFDMLIRPVLWKQLKVGSRIVSHRFTMGDWEPDQTVSMSVDGGLYDLHLWTITEAVKRRLEETAPKPVR
jgi:uncharacterized protein (TIGR03000 family)